MSQESYSSNSDYDDGYHDFAGSYEKHVDRIKDTEAREADLRRQRQLLDALAARAETQLTQHERKASSPVRAEDGDRAIASLVRQVDHLIINASQSIVCGTSFATHVGKFDELAGRLRYHGIGPETYPDLFANMERAVAVAGKYGPNKIAKERRRRIRAAKAALKRDKDDLATKYAYAMSRIDELERRNQELNARINDVPQGKPRPKRVTPRPKILPIANITPANNTDPLFKQGEQF